MAYSVDYVGDILKISKDSGEVYFMYPIEPGSMNQDKPSFSISMPGEDARNNVLMGVEGMGNDITVDFYLWNDGNDRANGTHTSTVKTLQEQMDYLMDTFHDPSFETGWTLSQFQSYNVPQWPSNSYDGHIESLRPAPNTSPKWIPMTLQFTVGSTV